MDKDAVLHLLNKPQNEWDKSELEEAFLLLLWKHKEAMDGWGSAIESCESLMQNSKLLLNMLEQSQRLQRVTQALITQATASTHQTKRGRGRPPKHADLSWIDGWLADSYKKYGRLSYRKLIIASFQDMYAENGLRRGRVEEQKVKGQINTFQKLISERNYQLKQIKIHSEK